MTDDLMLRRKWTVRAHGRQLVLVKRQNESSAHVIMKALLWALYLPDYPTLTVEVAIGDRFKPDLVQLAPDGTPRFWGEAGHVGVRKIESLVRRFPATHFALAKWDTALGPHADLVHKALAGRHRSTPFELIAFPADSAERFVDATGEIRIKRDQVETVWIA